jgi:hypothetical protein
MRWVVVAAILLLGMDTRLAIVVLALCAIHDLDFEEPPP